MFGTFAEKLDEKNDGGAFFPLFFAIILKPKTESLEGFILTSSKTTLLDSSMEMNHKKSKGWHMFKIVSALLFLHRKSSKKTNSLNVVASKGMWRRVLGAIRPLHHDHQHSTPPLITMTPSTTTTTTTPIAVDSRNVDAPMLPKLSSVGSNASSTFSIDIISQYASAENLQELDNKGGEDDGGDTCDGDKTIDARAEEFIAKFYEQMRLQRVDSLND
ncbi:hypothetical protein Syun_028727 [Stephania yunnanensis]|uniref:Uncharacterized protein n=1 Tax=Stephania yunnanensis TaxID=152371 RepID=A0AAP0EC20_9MAGN